MSDLNIAKDLIDEALEHGLETGKMKNRPYLVYKSIGGEFILVDFNNPPDPETISLIPFRTVRFRLVAVED